MVAKAREKTATIVFEDVRFPGVAITWIMGTKSLQLVSKGPGPASVMKPVSVKEPTIEAAQSEADKWFDSLDIFAPDDVEHSTDSDDDEIWH